MSDKTGRKRSKPYEVKGPKDRYLGAFDSAVEGAVCYAKFMQHGEGYCDKVPFSSAHDRSVTPAGMGWVGDGEIFKE